MRLILLHAMGRLYLLVDSVKTELVSVLFRPSSKEFRTVCRVLFLLLFFYPHSTPVKLVRHREYI